MHEKWFSGEIERLRADERVERLEVERVVGLCLEGKNFKNVLDAGTGSGLFAEDFSAHKLSVIGNDANPMMALAARNCVPEGKFLQASVEELPFPPESFGLIFFGLVLPEADEPLEVLKSAHRLGRKRVAVLEWPYRQQTFSPPMEHRLIPERLTELFQQGGFIRPKEIQMANRVLYLLDC